MAEGAIDPGDDERVTLAKKLEKRLQLDPAPSLHARV
jgi:hypothetical protein